MPLVDVLDDTFVRRPTAVVRAATADRWPAWLPGLRLVPTVDRGPKGIRWTARSDGLAGTAEVWLEPVPGGTVVHLYVRLDPVPGLPARRGQVSRRARHARRLPDRLRRTWKRDLHRWKDSLEGDRS